MREILKFNKEWPYILQHEWIGVFSIGII